ncbi:cystathionine beta-lyase [Paramesorhizobium deserti]|uniref:Cystathionine beta-lyase n=1 Tax=Paramesorhizobium deserti TaxID=1494590 RepID=A0A135HY78_9HYPH|nr:cystathionine beta-lyase [Paramesorhizobium deserti]KXF78108.1 cystathionine beta-lyase [Paramesorhizobium deserti]
MSADTRNSLRRETRLCHYGQPAHPGPANPPIVRASTILHDTVESYRDTKRRRESDDSVLSYGRRGTTTAHALMQAIADLEGAEGAWLFPSGVAAISSALTALLRPGDHLLMVDTIFGATRTFCQDILSEYGVSFDYFPCGTADITSHLRSETKLVFVESPGSQTFEVMDLPALCASAHAAGVLVMADNTYGSGWLYRPIELGCDLSIIAGTKYLGGHADVMMGAVSARGDAAARLRKAVHVTGQTLAPDEAYATLRGIRTLSLRLERHEGNALRLAEWFAMRPEVLGVLHPALPGHPGHEIWMRDASGSNGLLSVVFAPGFDAEVLLDRLTLFGIGSSWGGFESLAMPIDPERNRASLLDYPKEAKIVRFHAGLEHIDDLINDLEAALATL